MALDGSPEPVPLEAEPLPEGWIEARLQVDRRKLEAMITGIPLQNLNVQLPDASSFFANIEASSGAKICWPSRLKIGAKTKKDPYVKVLGPPEAVETAKNQIAEALQVKKDRVTLKMEIVHSAHSHIIGRRGAGSQAIMRRTGCHVHFPDGNKYSEDTSKSDQVSIAGAATQIDNARRLLRELSPVTIVFDIPWLLPSPPIIPNPSPDAISILIKRQTDCMLLCALRACVGPENLIFEALDSVCSACQMPKEMAVLCRLAMEVRTPTVAALNKPENYKRFQTLCSATCVNIEWPQNTQKDPNVLILGLNGPLHGILLARKFVLGVLPISLQFEIPTAAASFESTAIQNEFNINVQRREKASSGEQTTIVLRTSEEHINNIIRARQKILGLHDTTYLDDDYAFMKIGAAESLNSFAQSVVIPTDDLDDNTEIPLSPDPENSPIAHSLLKSAKQANGAAELWTGKAASRRASREQMLLKAHQAIYESLDTPDSPVRYPTNLWSGYGFSSSLPADLLKGMLDLNMKPVTDSKPSTQLQGNAPKGLTTLREEEEDQSSLSASSSSLSNTFSTRIFSKKSRIPAFSASTSIFESPLGSSDSVWDIAVFQEPTMVLAQLGLNEYTPNLREQEIDMDAFLLLDEAALRDIGVATVGARKKIHHAILKLRESAMAQGYSL